MEYKSDAENYSPHGIEIKATSNQELAFWMTRLPEALKNVPIVQLAIPGKFKIFPFFRKLYYGP